MPRFKALVRDLGLDDYWSKSGNWGDFFRLPAPACCLASSGNA
jgi:hypothetical protein